MHAGSGVAWATVFLADCFVFPTHQMEGLPVRGPVFFRKGFWPHTKDRQNMQSDEANAFATLQAHMRVWHKRMFLIIHE